MVNRKTYPPVAATKSYIGLSDIQRKILERLWERSQRASDYGDVNEQRRILEEIVTTRQRWLCD